MRINVDVNLQGPEQPLAHFLRPDLIAAERNLGERGLEVVQRPAAIHQGAKHHIARCSGKAVEIGDSHGSSCVSPLSATRQIKPAMYPAPNPLSMFTTDRPAAQLLSMVRSGVSPPREAP